MAKYRIKVETDARGVKTYYPQQRVLLFLWIPFKEWVGMNAWAIVWYDNLKDAENYIRGHVDCLRINRKKKIVKREYFVVSYKVK
jgi:hypothetical protein